MKIVRALSAFCLALLALATADCGGSKPASPPATAATSPADAPSAAGGAASWDDLCKLAAARVKRCGITGLAAQSIDRCSATSNCLETVYDPSAGAILKECLASNDCDACAKAAHATPSSAAKAYAAKATAKAATCPFFQGDPYFGSVGGLYRDTAVEPFNACVAKSDCSEAGSCLGMTSVSNESLITCQQNLGLSMSSMEVTPAPADATAGQGAAPDSADVTGKPAPELAAVPLAKSKLPAMKSLVGKTVIVHFFASWCAPCKKMMPALDALAAKHKKNVVVIGVSVDDDQKSAESFLSTTKIKFATGWDSQKATAKAYGVQAMPSTFVIDKKGNVAAILQGAHDDDVARIEKKL